LSPEIHAAAYSFMGHPLPVRFARKELKIAQERPRQASNVQYWGILNRLNIIKNTPPRAFVKREIRAFTQLL
jgi:hypothetical protein